MPPHEQEGLQADLAGMSLSDLCGSDRAYNVELSWLAFNWRVISLASAVRPLHQKLLPRERSPMLRVAAVAGVLAYGRMFCS